MRFIYPALLEHGEDVVVSFRDLPECLTSGDYTDEALLEAEDALEEAIAGRILDGEDIPIPSSPLPGEYPVTVPADTAAKAALTLALRASGMTQAELAKGLEVHDRVVRRMLDPRVDASVSSINDALRILGRELVIEVREGGARLVAEPV